MENSTNIMTLTGSDGTDFELPVAAAALSELVLEASGHGTDGDDTDCKSCSEPFELLLRVSSDPLGKIVAFLKHYMEEPMTAIPTTPWTGNTLNEVVGQAWYQDFMSDDNMSEEMVFEVMEASSYMGIKPLLELCCLKLTFLIHSKNTEEIYDLLKLPTMTPAEVEEASEKFAWVFDESAN